jgi:hypothetical protein
MLSLWKRTHSKSWRIWMPFYEIPVPLYHESKAKKGKILEERYCNKLITLIPVQVLEVNRPLSRLVSPGWEYLLRGQAAAPSLALLGRNLNNTYRYITYSDHFSIAGTGITQILWWKRPIKYPELILVKKYRPIKVILKCLFRLFLFYN